MIRLGAAVGLTKAPRNFARIAKRRQLVEAHAEAADAAVEGYSRWFVSRLKLLEKSLEDKQYLCSNRFTIADICVSYAINLAEALGIEQAFKPNIKRWSDNLFSRPAFIKSKEYKYEPNE